AGAGKPSPVDRRALVWSRPWRGRAPPHSRGLAYPASRHSQFADGELGLDDRARGRGVVPALESATHEALMSTPIEFLFVVKTLLLRCRSARVRAAASGRRLGVACCSGSGVADPKEPAVRVWGRSRWMEESPLGALPGPLLRVGVDEQLAVDG